MLQAPHWSQDKMHKILGLGKWEQWMCDRFNKLDHRKKCHQVYHFWWSKEIIKPTLQRDPFQGFAQQNQWEKQGRA